MKTVITITLENEMDLILIQKRCAKLSELLFLTISCKASFSTAVTEICREVIDETNEGVLQIGIRNFQGKHTLIASISFPASFSSIDGHQGIHYAKKLVTAFKVSTEGKNTIMQLHLSLSRNAGLDAERIEMIRSYFEKEEPINAYDEIKRKNAQQEEQLKEWRSINEKKSEFLSVASHELKTPLTTIKAYTQLALTSDDNECSDTVRKYLQKIETQSNKINNLVQQLLDLSKIEAGIFYLKHEEVHFKEFLEDIVNVHRQILSGNTLELVSNEECVLMIDKLRVEQVISNIILNASKYSGRHSVIQISAHCRASELMVEVTDNGIGMSENAQARVFDKFYREHANATEYTGIGMGMYIASNIIAQHGGRIWVTSELNKGSTFCFTLPI